MCRAPRGRILVVEDDRGARQALASLLADEGYDVHAVGDAHAAVGMLEAGGCDLLLTGHRLAGMDGLALRAWWQAPDPTRPVVVMSAYESPGSGLDVLTKPIDVTALLGRIAALLCRARGCQEA